MIPAVWLTEYDSIVYVLTYFLLLLEQISYQCGKIITREELDKILAKEKPEELEVMALELETLEYYQWDRNLYLDIF